MSFVQVNGNTKLENVQLSFCFIVTNLFMGSQIISDFTLSCYIVLLCVCVTYMSWFSFHCKMDEYNLFYVILAVKPTGLLFSIKLLRQGVFKKYICLMGFWRILLGTDCMSHNNMESQNLVLLI